MEKFPEKFNPLEEKFTEALHKKKAETEPEYDGENPASSAEAVEELKKMGVVKEEAEIKKEKEEEKEKRLEKMAELAVESAFGKDVFERPDMAKERKPKYKPYPQSEIERIGNLLVDYTEKFRTARSKKAREVYREKLKKLRKELEKAKAVRDKYRK
jgi:hypothetical protein